MPSCVALQAPRCDVLCSSGRSGPGATERLSRTNSPRVATGVATCAHACCAGSAQATGTMGDRCAPSASFRPARVDASPDALAALGLTSHGWPPRGHRAPPARQRRRRRWRRRRTPPAPRSAHPRSRCLARATAQSGIDKGQARQRHVGVLSRVALAAPALIEPALRGEISPLCASPPDVAASRGAQYLDSPIIRLSVEDEFACGVEIGAPKLTPVARLVVLETDRRPQGQRAVIARLPAHERGPREGAPTDSVAFLVYPADGNRGGLSGRHGHRAE
jgi:hypothetical protein